MFSMVFGCAGQRIRRQNKYARLAQKAPFGALRFTQSMRKSPTTLLEGR
jgi:hypothetical protein